MQPLVTEIRPGIWLDGRRAVFFAAQRILAVADIHWGYVASHRARGHLLPAWGDEEIDRTLAGLLRDHRPATMVWLGDSLHALDGATAAERFLSTCAVPTVVVAGNHDRRWTHATVEHWTADGLLFHHGDRPWDGTPPAMEVTGHLHPAFAWNDGAGSRVKLPALVAGPTRLILPAFSPWAAGAPWASPLGPEEKLWAIAPRRLFAVSPCPSRPTGSSV